MGLHVVILAGGSGTRFWPKSSAKKPKQFLNLCSPKKSMLQLTFERIQGLCPASNQWVVTHKNFAKDTKRQIPAISTKNILAEPLAKNTSAALALAARQIQAADPEATLICLPADHYVEDTKAFQKTLQSASNAAESLERIVVIGIKPTFPATGFGYIEKGRLIENPAFEVARFHEKPNAFKAQEYINSGRFFWNAGIFVFTLPLFWREIKMLASDFGILDEWKGSPKELEKLYKGFPNIPFDVAVMEKTRKGALLEAQFRWSDVGSWASLLETLPKNSPAGLVWAKSHFSLNSQNVVVESPKKFVATLGVKDLVVVETPDALLICSLDHSQEVKKVVEHLQKTNQKKLL